MINILTSELIGERVLWIETWFIVVFLFQRQCFKMGIHCMIHNAFYFALFLQQSTQRFLLRPFLLQSMLYATGGLQCGGGSLTVMKFSSFFLQTAKYMVVGSNVEGWASQHGKIKEKGRRRYDIFEKCYIEASRDRYYKISK